MKAGIFQKFDGTLMYVAKDRSIKAGAHAGLKLTTYDKGERGYVIVGDKHFDAKRVGAVPNGCTDHEQALLDFARSQVDDWRAEHPEIAEVAAREFEAVEVAAREFEAVETLRSDSRGEAGNPGCQCIDCDGEEPAHSPDCEYMRDLHRETEKPSFSFKASQLLRQDNAAAKSWHDIGEPAMRELEEKGVIRRTQDEVEILDGPGYIAWLEVHPELGKFFGGHVSVDASGGPVDYAAMASELYGERGTETMRQLTMPRALGTGYGVVRRIDELQKVVHIDFETHSPPGVTLADFVKSNVEYKQDALKRSASEMGNALAGLGMQVGKTELQMRFYCDATEMIEKLARAHRGVMLIDGWRPVGRQSARKHRRQGDEVQFRAGRYWWRKSTNWRAYCGPIAHLRGERALVTDTCANPNIVLVQFDDTSLTHSGRTAPDPDVGFEDMLGFSWHAFPRCHFKKARA